MNSITHKMHLDAPVFNKIKSGEKCVELRLCDKKRSLINVGDNIVFESREDNPQTFIVRIVDLIKSSSFGEVINQLPVECFGHKNKDAVRDEIYSIYSCEQELEYGVVGIKMALVER